MTKLLLGVLAFGCTMAIVASTTAQFNDMLKITTIINSLATYSNYGCHCGSNSTQGGAPVDKTDKCCHKHVCCYIKAQQKGCVPETTNYGFAPHKAHEIKCDKTNNECKEEVCECDKKAAECFREGMETYDMQFHNITSSPRCHGPKPFC